LVGIHLIDKRFKEVKGNTLKIGDGKEDLLSVFGKLSFTSPKIDLILEYKSLELIGASATE